MRAIRAAARLVALAAILVVSTLLIVGLSWLPVGWRGIRLSAWFFTWGTRLLLPALGLRFQCDDLAAVQQHRGFIFANHTSFFDTVVMSYVLPMRYVAKAGVKRWPFIGWIAAATGTMFVDRNDKAARAGVRKTLAERVSLNAYPPVVIFPEGTRNSAAELLPFRYGVFDIARETQIPYLLCAIIYEQPEIVTWHSRSENLLTTVGRMIANDTSRVRLIPLQVVQAGPEDDAEQLAAAARRIVSQGVRQGIAGW